MSESVAVTTEPSPLPFIIMKIIAGHAYALKALTTTSVDRLDYATLHTSYKNAMNLTHTLYSTENLTDWFATLVTETEDLMLEHNATITDHNTLTAQVT
jgi:hypothetical protein